MNTSVLQKYTIYNQQETNNTFYLLPMKYFYIIQPNLSSATTKKKEDKNRFSRLVNRLMLDKKYCGIFRNTFDLH